MSAKTYISSDYAFNRPKKMEEWEDDMDMEIVPVDLNWASVPEEKKDSDNLSTMQESLRRRFSLGE